MTVHELTLESLMDKLDGGRVAEAFAAEMRRVVSDMEDRPGDNKERTVNLSVRFSPVVDDQGNLDEVRGKFFVTSSVPKRRSKVYSFGVRNGGKMVFNDLSEDDIHQQTIE